jgi:hypothetical protein
MIDDRDLYRLLPCFAGEHGASISEDAIADALERLQKGGDASLYFRYGEHVVSVSAIAANGVPARFGFVQQPVQPAGEEQCN